MKEKLLQILEIVLSLGLRSADSRVTKILWYVIIVALCSLFTWITLTGCTATLSVQKNVNGSSQNLTPSASSVLEIDSTTLKVK